MRKKSLFYRFTFGLLIGALIAPAQPAQAQWTVYDPAAYTQRVKAELRRIREWVDEVQFYQQLYTTSVQQLTTLRGVLQRVDEELAKDQETARLTNDIAEIIQGSYKLQNQVRGMVKYQVTALQQIDDRLRNGIFDPDKDIADLEEYLLYSMGRNSKQTIQLAIRAARTDAQLNKWNTERQGVAEKLAKAQEQLHKLNARLDRAKRDSDPLMVDHLNELIQATKTQIDALQKNLAELDEKIATHEPSRSSALGNGKLRLSDRINQTDVG
jgi:hypothetical protein